MYLRRKEIHLCITIFSNYKKESRAQFGKQFKVAASITSLPDIFTKSYLHGGFNNANLITGTKDNLVTIKYTILKNSKLRRTVWLPHRTPCMLLTNTYMNY